MSVKKQVSMLGFAKELPNICSLTGLFCALFGIYFAIQGNFYAAIIAILWAVLFDWYDGIIARKIKGRTKEQGELGIQLDSIIDMVSFGVFPAIVLLSYGHYSLWFMPGAFVVVAATAIRLSYFNVYGLMDSQTYKGLAMDNNALILAFVFLFEIFFTQANFSIILYVVLMILAALNLSSISIHKFGAKWVYLLILYVLTLTSIFGWLLYTKI